ncbi:MAG: hypothetical protein E7214_04905 [Clostridium sp.]|nr:hypothetical protein [Clostridium sp.]
MDCYEILGVDKNSSMEELRKAYEKRVKKIENEVDNRKNADAFFKVLEEAYKEALFNMATSHKSGQDIESTVMFTKEELEDIRSEDFDDELCYDEEPYEDDDYAYNDYDGEKRTKTKKRKSKSRSRKQKDNSKKSTDKKNEKKKNRNKDGNEVEGKREKKKKSGEKDEKGVKIIALPVKIIAFPIMIILSAVILILRFIDAIIWIVTKILIVASIAGASIYGYKVYRGEINMDLRVFLACGGVFILSVILPYITRTVPDSLDIINNSIKHFIFG